MIEFGTKRSGNGKKSRIHKKFPRKKIFNRRDEKYCNWYPNNWDEDNYPYFHGNLVKFLKANIGRPVDKVFPEFLSRCRKSASRYNLKQEFYDMFKKKEDITYKGGFYLTNGIINYKKKKKSPYRKSYVTMEDFNRSAMPADLNRICRECDRTHNKQYLGKFRIGYTLLKSVYVIERKVWEEAWSYGGDSLKLVNNYRRCVIYGVGSGINRWVWATQDRMSPKVTYEANGAHYLRDKPDLIFITKIIK